jgi:uncharacterized protein involved in exopolysaccharide biosynthesis
MALPAQSSRALRPDPERDALALRVHLLSLWRYRITVGAISVLGGLAGFAWSVVVPVSYEASATVAVSPPTVADATSTVPQLVARTTTVFQSQGVVERAVRESKLSEPPRKLTPSMLPDGVLSVSGVPETNLVKVVVRLDDPRLTATLANRVSQIGIDAVNRLSQSAIDVVDAALKAVVDQAAASWRGTEERYETFRRTAQVEVARRDLNNLLSQRDEFQKLVVDLETEKARLTRQENELAKRARTDTLTQRIDTSPLLEEAARQQSGTAKDLLGLQVRSDSTNGVYQGLDLALATSRASVAALEKRVAELGVVGNVGAGHLARLGKLYQDEAELDRLDNDRKLARRLYDDAMTQYQTTKVSAVARVPYLAIIDPAVVPERPMSRWLLRNSLLGFVLGMFATACYVLARQAFLSSSFA